MTNHTLNGHAAISEPTLSIRFPDWFPYFGQRFTSFRVGCCNTKGVGNVLNRFCMSKYTNTRQWFIYVDHAQHLKLNRPEGAGRSTGA